MSSRTSNFRIKRWGWFLALTLILNFVAVHLMAPIVHDGFQLSVSCLALLPIIWALILFFVFRSRPERLVSYFALAVSLLWVGVLYDEMKELWIGHF